MSCMHDADVVIVGAGLTGLRAALEVSRAGLSVLVVERNHAVGGRMQTNTVRGALLDRGFQVLLPAYPEFKTLPPLTSLQCKAFTAGARVRFDSSWYDIVDPRRNLGHFLRATRHPLGTLTDLVRFGVLVQACASAKIATSDLTTAQMIDKWNLSERFASGFLKPFLRGVLLDPTLSSNAALARFYLKTFARGAAVLPAGGIQALPELLANTIGRQHFLLGTPVTSVSKNRVVLENGDDLSCRYVICTCDALAAAALGGPEQTIPYNSTTTMYFLAERAPYPEPIITLDGDGVGPINNLAVLSNVQPSYAPPGKALISASVLGSGLRLSEPELLAAARQQLHSWFGPQTADWEHLQSVSILDALPARPRISSGWTCRDGIFYAGDYLAYGSQNGALMAGREVAQAVCRDLSDLEGRATSI